MCYSLILSTTSDEDLAERSSELVHFSRDLPGIVEESRLQYPAVWYVGSKSGCSCTFRHLHSPDLGFGEPEDWYPEQADEIEATLRLIKIIRELVERGFCVDCFDAWAEEGSSSAPAGRISVDLGAVPNEAFRLIENHYFDFTIVA